MKNFKNTLLNKIESDKNRIFKFEYAEKYQQTRCDKINKKRRDIETSFKTGFKYIIKFIINLSITRIYVLFLITRKTNMNPPMTFINYSIYIVYQILFYY